MPRVLLGDYVIDSASTGSTSTTAGCRAFPEAKRDIDSDPQTFNWRKTKDGAEISFWVHVSAASVAAMKTARDALVEVVTNPSGDLVYESSAGVALDSFKVSDGTYLEIAGEATIFDGEDSSCMVLCIFNLTKSGTDGSAPESNDDENEIPGLTGTLEVNGERNTAGRLTLLITGKFKDGADVGPLTVTSVEDAGGFARFVFSGSPDLSTVKPGARIEPSGMADYPNPGIVTAVDEAGFEVTTDIAFNTDDTGTATIKGTRAEENAKAFLATVRARTGNPGTWDWFPPANELRVASEAVSPSTPRSVNSDGETVVAGESTATITLREMPRAFLQDGGASADILDRVKDLQVTVNIQPHEMDQRGSADGYNEIIIAGTVFINTEWNATYDANSTPPADITNAEVGTILDLIRDVMLTKRVETGATELRRQIGQSGESGEIPFSILLVSAGANVLEWDESIEYRITSNRVYSDDVEGNEFIYEKKFDGIIYVKHALRVVRKDAPQTYVPPPDITSNFDTVDATRNAPTIRRVKGSPTITYEMRFTQEYRQVRLARMPTQAGGNNIQLLNKMTLFTD